jgi:hypothetical protein
MRVPGLDPGNDARIHHLLQNPCEEDGYAGQAVTAAKGRGNCLSRTRGGIDYERDDAKGGAGNTGHRPAA